jgi:YebC/PmpR family DNA-binding regulatory protein
MSGHSKWHSIKHKKSAADAKRGKIFTKMAAEIAIAAQGGADPATNFKLRLAIQKAKAANVPASNIERAIARGSGQSEGAKLEELVYEGYGPAGVAIMVKALSDNRNRTGPAVKSVFTKHGGTMGSQGSVAYLFEQKGVIICKEGSDKDALSLMAIEAGAEDIDDSGKQLIIYTQPNKLEAVRDALGENNVESAEVKQEPSQTVVVEDEAKAKTVLNLMEALDDLDDVVEVTSNFDIPEEVLNKIG